MEEVAAGQAVAEMGRLAGVDAEHGRHLGGKEGRWESTLAGFPDRNPTGRAGQTKGQQSYTRERDESIRR